MKKKFLAILLLATILSSSFFAKAANISKPSLTFSGTTAYCSGSASEFGKSITINLSLWQGNTQVASWNASGYSLVQIQQSCEVELGATYTLKLNGTINGVAFPEVRVIKTNHEMNK